MESAQANSNFHSNGSCKNQLAICKVANTSSQPTITSSQQLHHQTLITNQAPLIQQQTQNHSKSLANRSTNGSPTHSLQNTNLCTDNSSLINVPTTMIVNQPNNQQLFSNNQMRGSQTTLNQVTNQQLTTALTSPITTHSNTIIQQQQQNNFNRLNIGLALTGKSQSSSNVLQSIHSKKPHATARHYLNRANSMDFQHRHSTPYRYSEDSMISNDDSMMSDYMFQDENSCMPITSTTSVSTSLLDTSSQHDISHFFRKIQVNCPHDQQEQNKQNKQKSKSQPMNQQVNNGSTNTLNSDTNAISNAISDTISKEISDNISTNILNSNTFNQLNNQVNNQINATIIGPINEAINNTLNVSTQYSTPITTTQIINAAKNSIDVDEVVANATFAIQHQPTNPQQIPTTTTVLNKANESLTQR